MAERALRGTSIGAKSLENEEGVIFAERSEVEYVCERGHHFTVALARGVDAPPTWECRCGASADLVETDVAIAEVEETDDKPVRTHWDMLTERRTPEELDQLLAEQLDLLHTGRLRDGAHYRKR
ncbi:MAG: RNA polymerase-binding protein RbpA [Varibaculum sp.]|nr:RNA polymerase-binding protein RbpA [Varibaculum sp.]